MRGVYTAVNKYTAFTQTGPYPLLMLSPKQGIPVELVEAHVTFGSTTNQQLEIKISKVSTWNITNYSAVTPNAVEPNDKAADSLVYGSGSGASSAVLGNAQWDEEFSTLPGWHWTPTRDGRILVKAVNAQSTDGIAIVMVPTPASIDIVVELTFREIG